MVPREHDTNHSTPVEDSVPHRKIMATPAFLYAVVLAMGAIGATLRYLIELVIPTSGFPWATLLINLVGCYIIYIVYQWLDRRVHIPHAIARGIGVGLVGAFTTLSAFCTESLTLLEADEYVLFAAYVTATIFGTFLASLAGWATCSLLAYRRLKQLQRRRMQHRLEMQRAKQLIAHDTANFSVSESMTSSVISIEFSNEADQTDIPSEGRRS